MELAGSAPNSDALKSREGPKRQARVNEDGPGGDPYVADPKQVVLAQNFLAAQPGMVAGNQNNFFMYRDPAQGRLVFLPWGTDGTLRASGEGRSGHFSTGLIANKILSEPCLRDR